MEFRIRQVSTKQQARISNMAWFNKARRTQMQGKQVTIQRPDICRGV